ncbi:MAG: exodeoxyribonuclease VII large subunit [Planctomycetia bacterium]|nr:exodeoxyribonuclease VII large subunit [Planctomycetia bacterium]
MSAPDLSTPRHERVLSVGELTDQIKGLLEGAFSGVWVSGEISNLSRPQSGHYYLTLKDDRAQLRAVLWRSAASRLRFALEDGLEVICQGDIDLYAPRGSYQLVIQKIEPKGIGALELALRRLRERLAAEGLFDPARKRPLPRFPRRIAVVTSPSGAAIRDFLEVLRRRWRGADVLVVPVRVQGDEASREIAAAIATVNRLPIAVDCLVVARGGGSLEDLWAFNEEPVVRAIHASRIPVVSAVGHEIDVTLADLVADVRALTPSEAAERVAPAADELTATLAAGRRRMTAALRGLAVQVRLHLDRLSARRALRRPFDRVHDLIQRLDELSLRSGRVMRRGVREARHRADALAVHLESLSPLGVLRRGYSLTSRTADGQIVRDAGQLTVGELITTRFAAGEATSRVVERRQAVDRPRATDHRPDER